MDKNKILKYLKETYRPGCIFIDLVNGVEFEVDDNAIIYDDWESFNTLHRPKRKMRQKNVKLFYPVI